MIKLNITSTLLVTAIICAGSYTSHAANIFFNNGDGDRDLANPLNWGPDNLPGNSTSDIAIVSNSTTAINPATLSSDLVFNNPVTLALRNTAFVSVTGGSATFNQIQVAVNGVTGTTSTFSQSAGGVSATSTFRVGIDVDASGVYNISGTGSLSVAGITTIGDDGFFNVSGSNASVSFLDGTTVASNGGFGFTFDASGVSTVAITGTLAVDTNSLLSIDGSAYTGGTQTITLAAADTFTGTIDSGNISVTGLGTAGVNYNILQNFGGNGDLAIQIIPEPGAYAMLLGLVGLGFVITRRKKV